MRIETGQAFRDHFGGPYAVIHRVDIHATVWEAALTASRRGIPDFNSGGGHPPDRR